MSYPDYPSNRLVVNNVDLSEQYQMVLVDGYVLSPPSPKTYIVDIPGGNGKLDLTETLLGDTAYDNRKQEFTFYVINATTFESTKTAVTNFLHGKSFDYTMTMDPDYTYHGRFEVSSYEHSPSAMGKIGVIKVTIDSDPYKYKPERQIMVNAVGGKRVLFASGRKRVSPKIETDCATKVIFDNRLTRLPVGVWKIDGLLFELGQNEVYFNTYDIRNIIWRDFITDNVTWRTFKTSRLFEWYKSKGNYVLISRIWSSLEDNTWDSLSSSTWTDLTHMPGTPDDISDVYVHYDWGDL